MSPNSSSNETLTFNFTTRNDNPENQTKGVLIEIRNSSGTLLKSQTVDLPANTDYPLSWTVNNVNVATSETGVNNTFTVEINRTRAWLEVRADGADPYTDNVAQNAVKGYMSSSIPPCSVVKTSNIWSVTHEIYQWSGHREYGTYTANGHTYPYSYCVTDSSSNWSSTISYHESYKITEVMFRSKSTKDKYGGDGWINALSDPSSVKVKAGYGFEIKFIDRYETNTYSASPKSWYTTCSGKSVYPSVGSEVSAPNAIYVKMPFTNAYGNKVQYTLLPSSTSGDWDDISSTYEMPYHDFQGIKTTREVFVNETARDGAYTMNVQTYPYFYGGYDKPSSAYYFCDSKNITIHVVGADSDDIKSHVTQ